MNKRVRIGIASFIAVVAATVGVTAPIAVAGSGVTAGPIQKCC